MSGPSREAAGWPRTLGDGRYRGMQKLGEGSTSVVLSALDSSTGCRVAVRLARSPGDGPGYDLRRFRADYDHLEHIRHPQLIPVQQFGVHEGRPWYAMPIYDHGTLHQRLQLRGRIEPTEALIYTFRVLMALSVLHGRGLVHRDVKPSNVLLEHGDHIRLSDIGICTQPRGLAAIGTPSPTRRDARGFRAPEQTSEARTGSVAADLYGAGATLYRLLTGVRGTMLFSPSRSRTLLLPVPRSVRPVILRATSLDPDARYRDAADMARDVLDARDLLRLRNGDKPVADRWMASFYVPVEECATPTSTARVRSWLRTVLAV